jgi:hypothetical protein
MVTEKTISQRSWLQAQLSRVFMKKMGCGMLETDWLCQEWAHAEKICSDWHMTQWVTLVQRKRMQI